MTIGIAMKWRSLFIFAFLFFSANLWAIELIEWKSDPRIPVMILPKLESESEREAVERYLKFLKNNPDMKRLIERDQFKLPELKVGEVSKINPKDFKKSFAPHFLFMANHFDDLKPNDSRIADFFPFMKQNGAVSYLLPVSADGALSEQDAKDYRTLIADSFDVLFGMGGDDVHPELYGEKVTFAVKSDLNKTRDISEIELIKTYTEKEKGVYYGVCRGSQICAVAKEEKLVQDLKLEQGVGPVHRDRVHPVDLAQRKDNLIKAFIGTDKESMNTMSYHHQAVKPREGMGIDVIASADSGKDYVVEAYQFKNGLGLAYQFHPELLTEDQDNLKIMKGMIEYAAFVKKQKLLNQNCTNLIMQFIAR